jgi:V/A-type H+-transporting ATPase subunit D
VPERTPAGRAGRLWLIRRLDAAQRGRELLERKRQLLRRQFDHLVLLAEEQRRAWTAACAEGRRWGLRAVLLGGSEELALVAGTLAGQAGVTVAWRNTMGASHPDEARCVLPALDPAVAAAANAAFAPAAAAYRQALELGAGVAVAETARDRIGAELRATQRRLRALERHRLPALAGALQTLEMQLDELEREERVTARWALNRREER